MTREMESLTCSSNLEGHFTEQTMQQLPREEKWGYAQEDRAFVDAIVNSSPPLVTAFDGLMSVEIANAVYESVRSGAPVPIHAGAICVIRVNIQSTPRRKPESPLLLTLHVARGIFT